MLAASEDGMIFYSFLSGNNNQWSLILFFLELAASLDVVNPSWRDEYILLMDNCRSHVSKVTAAVLRHLEVPVLYTAPASYEAVPAEAIFGAIKTKKLDTSVDEYVSARGLF